MVPELGTILGGKYRILRVLGEGGMGSVYEAENTLTLKRAAIKWLHPQVLPHDEGYLRVLHEARASARIRHRNVVDVYDVVREGDSIFLVMELLDGEPLSAFIARGGLTVRDYVALLLPALDGLAAVHAAGVVHRDIKPENIFLVSEPGRPEPLPKVIDFGISKVTDPESGPNLTRSGVTMGTPKYVSYEQLAGARDVDARADIYAVGVMLYEALTGRPPYDALTFGQQAIRFATTVPRAPRELRPEVPEALEAVVMRAIARDRTERYADVASLVRELAPFASAAIYARPLAAFPARSDEVPTLGVGHALTTTPLHTTPQPAIVPAPVAPSPLPQATTQRAPRSSFLRGAVGALPLVAVGLALAVWWRLQAAEPRSAPLAVPPPAALAPAAAPVVPTVEQAPGPMPELTPTVAAPAESGAPLSPRPTTRKTRTHAWEQAAMNAVPTQEHDAGVSEAAREPSPTPDRQVHRAGRVTRDQF